MKKNIFLLLVIFCLCLINCNVLAESKDIEAKYDVDYNVELVSGILNNNSIDLTIDNYEFQVSTSMNDVEIVIIRAEDAANDYAKGFTDSEENYYLIFYQNGKKINLGDIDIKITSANKVLNIYSNSGKLLEKSNEKINLTNNDYFLVITDLINIDESDYIITDDGNNVDSLDGIEIEDNSVVEVYNSKNVKVNSFSALGTNYKVLVTTGEKSKTYTIIVKGDTTGDSKINLNDITRLYHYYKGIEKMDECYVLAGDVANNNIINLNDVTKLYHYYKKIITSL